MPFDKHLLRLHSITGLIKQTASHPTIIIPHTSRNLAALYCYNTTVYIKGSLTRLEMAPWTGILGLSSGKLVHDNIS